MMWHGPDVPPGYVAFRVGAADVVALGAVERSVREALLEGSLYEYAAHHSGARRYAGRGIAYGVPLPDGEQVVVRRSRHGGLLQSIMGERFLLRTRAHRELESAVRLARVGVPTPEVLAYATYQAGGPFRRADVITREISAGQDFGALLTGDIDSSEKETLLLTVASLLNRCTQAGVRHPDLNVKNILIAHDENEEREAWLLDVDRVWFDEPGEQRVAEANLRRLTRSLRKWRELYGISVDEADIDRLVRSVEAGWVDR